MSIPRHHAEWLSLVEQSGPFLSMPVLLKHFRTGLEAHDPERFRTLRMAYEEWEDKWETTAIHNAWIKFVLNDLLELTDDVLAEGQAIPQSLAVTVAEHAETLRPDFVVREPGGKTNRMLIRVYPATQELEKPVKGRTWKASPATRMMELLHGTGVRLGLVTNGEHWMLVDAPKGETTGFASWYAWLWLQEQITLRAFRSLLYADRFFGVPNDQTLEALLAESAQNQQEVTDQLGYQVRNAVEILIRELDRSDQDHGRVLLGDVPEERLYEAALTVMMRLVFLFCAEERKLLPDDQFHNDNYAVSTLSKQLRETSDQHGEEVLERRHDAWCRLLSTFRAVHGGVTHDRFNMPAYGGHLFDPDRFPFLEGRKRNTFWHNTPADPLPVNNRTVLHLLEALQLLEVRVPGGGGAERRRISFRALDIEQIGHVYEGLLDHTAKRATEPVLGIAGSKKKEPEVTLSKLETLRERGDDPLIAYLNKESGRSENALRNNLDVEIDHDEANRFQAACAGDAELWERVKPFASLIRNDSFGRPVIIPTGSVFVTTGTDRRSSGTHYTPRSLTEPIVQYTLEPLVYAGPAEGRPKEQWKLRSAKELLELNICDMACGSGAFLVQACRYMSERLMEAWDEAEKQQGADIRITPYGEVSSGKADEMLIPKDPDERIVYARRIVAGRCLYGVDINPLAVEMAKLSLWLLTLAKDMPFTFLDHCIRCGDSLIGISRIEQLQSFSLNGNSSQKTFAHEQISKRINAAKLLRRQIESFPSLTVEDTDRKKEMLKRADEQTRRLAYAADRMVALYWQSMSDTEREKALDETLFDVEYKFKDLPVEQLDKEARRALQDANCQQTFHWPLEFPEVFERGGFDAFVGNPPFLGGTRISTSLGTAYFAGLQSLWGQANRADLCAYFFLRSFTNLNGSGLFGLLGTNTIAQGDTRVLALDRILNEGGMMVNAVPSMKWPGTAVLEVSRIIGARSKWEGICVLNGQPVTKISSFLDEAGSESKPLSLSANAGLAFNGSKTYSDGFLLTPAQATDHCSRYPAEVEVIRPYLNGRDFNSSPIQEHSRYVIDFRDWSLEEVQHYGGAFEHVNTYVRPDREKSKYDDLRTFWWRFQRIRKELYASIQTLDRTLVTVRHSKHWCVAFSDTSRVFSDALVVFASDRVGDFATLQSSIHEVWARQYASTMKGDLRYTPTDCFLSFAFPSQRNAPGMCGQPYHDHRCNVMVERDEGLTSTYNRFHDPEESATDIQKLRELHVEMDNAVAAAYDWNDLDLDHGFHETKQGVRYTISEPARREVLQRLLKLNHERYEEEVREGLHEKGKKGKAKKPAAAKPRKPAKKPALATATLFDLDDDVSFPVTERDKFLCGLVCDLVATEPGLHTTAYLDALVIALGHERHKRLLTGRDHTTFAKLCKAIPTASGTTPYLIPWSDLKDVLELRQAITLDSQAIQRGPKLEEVRKSYPAVDTELVALIRKASAELHDLQSQAQPNTSERAEILHDFEADRQQMCGAAT